MLCTSALARASETPQPAEDMKHDDPALAPKPAPETIVTDQTAASDDDRVGAYRQPGWTERRRFPTTRVYVIPAGDIQAEVWLEVKTPGEDPGATRLRSLYELAFGLGKRIQLDLYLRTESDGGGPLVLESERVELRWAFADWGVIPGNPTLYLEFIRPHEGPFKGEVKLLFGGSLAPRWHWGANLSWERELWGNQTNEYAVTAAISHTVIERTLSIGAETRVELVDQRPHFGKFVSYEFLIGPSLRFIPLPRFALSLVWLFGAAAERDVGTDPLPGFGAIVQPTLVVNGRL